ncbi:hypothetical protein EXIGLDRAFT_759733 [Exidia glandulosa HHB12029]|uniref:Stealth protein CR3 conserved region 3 domain-containing protein n=1 Tax=Exidia glandulosa HHB12029 TaxID=1314781 RepID=A0A165PSF7_EXIGL|nr:hypothetical protein EXIGLDRAFT_759733 [Exidia glandulosa HHB12029]
MSEAARRTLAFAAVATVSTAGLWFLWPQGRAPTLASFRMRTASISMPESLDVTCAVGDDPEDTLFVLHTTDDNYNASYLPFRSSPRNSLPTLDHTDSLPLDCLESFFSKGTQCEDWMTLAPRFDFVWTWVNGTDKLHQQAKLETEREFFPARQRPAQRPGQTPPSKEAKHFRDHDELRHSLRSVLNNFRQHTASFHLLTADFPIPAYEQNPVMGTDLCGALDSSSWRLGQVPQFLNLEQDRWLDGDIGLTVSHHSQFFSNYSGTSFNSFAIESQIPHISNLSKHIVYMNDDYFLTGPLKPYDFYTPEFGTVLRIQSDLMVTPAGQLKRPSGDGSGEWLSLEYSNDILSRRFGYRRRPYVIHEAKSASTVILREMVHTFPAAFDETAHNKFRMTPSLGPQRDLHTFFTFAHYVVERWREAALWAWVVARSADRPGEKWLETAWEELAGPDAKTKTTLTVRSTRRRTLEPDYVKDMLGGESSVGLSTYDFSSKDGYPYSSLGNQGTKKWPDMRNLTGTAEDDAKHPHFKCELSYDTCFAGASDPAALFTRIAFDQLACGDCIMNALVAKSGELGLEALLPARNATAVPRTAEFNPPPMLARTPRWQDADFSLSSVVPTDGQLDLRSWTLQLLHRYRFVIGSTPSRFVSLQSSWQAKQELKKLDRDASKYQLLCVNDDITRQAEDVDKVFRDWQEGKWGSPAAWERP